LAPHCEDERRLGKPTLSGDYFSTVEAPLSPSFPDAQSRI
jgi:hypothetical protein